MLITERLQRWTRQTTGSVVVAVILGACASQMPGGVLNSDMIMQRYGNYAVEVLYSNEQQRISSLYSTTNNTKTTRTFAIVDFDLPAPVALTSEHRLISSGQSIGEVFRSANWKIEKHHVFIGELKVSEEHARIAVLMDIVLPQSLAAHVYLFVVTKDERTLTYATITEIHHPDYLTADDLVQIYGEILFDDSERNSIDDFVSLPEDY